MGKKQVVATSTPSGELKAPKAIKKQLRKFVLMSWTDSNMYEAWTWEVFLTERADGSLSTGARQFGDGLPSTRLRGTYGIRSGRVLKEAIEKLFATEVLQDVDWKWSALLRKIDRFAPKLATEVRQQIEAERDAERRDDEEAEQRYEVERPIREWVNRSTWPHSTASGAGGIVSSIANARLSAGVTAYVGAYRSEHGRFPTGTHHIEQAIGDAIKAAKCAAQGNGIGRAFSAAGRVQMTVQFPEEQ